MTASDEGSSTGHAWFLGAYWRGEEQPDQTDRFISEGIWENGYEDRYLPYVRSIQVGDRVAIKSVYNRKNGLPFDNRGHLVSTMKLMAIGVVTSNLGDGRRLHVDWTPVDPPREWYFYTYRPTVWKIVAGAWHTDNLLKFAFDNKPQDIKAYRNRRYWRDRFGDLEPETSYSIDDIIGDGCFIERARLETMLERLDEKKNLILQGPPGTGKTWLAKRLAYALVGRKSSHRVRPFQFHPNLSYEDFVRGYRPSAEGRLDLVDGPFLEAVKSAQSDRDNNRDNNYVVVIEEINRGNPAQIFGEMLTLLEADKRSPDEAISLSYPRHAAERIHIPPNLYVIGTMNVADRSLALVDFALRRRFAFVDLEPTFGPAWRNWMSGNVGLPAEFLIDIESRLSLLNRNIADDAVLGPQFRVGHSVVTPAPDVTIGNPEEWFRWIVETEIAPLLGEYWFDDPGKAREEVEKLLAGVNP